LLIAFLFPGFLFSQKDFNSIYSEHYPSKDGDSKSTEINLLEKFESETETKKDTLLMCLSKIYLADFYYAGGEYENAINYLIKAENLSEKIKHILLTGRILHKKASVYTALDDYESSIELFERALEKSAIAKDSHYMAITMEQLASLYGYQEEKEKSFYYFEKAIPLLKKYSPEKDLAVCYSNYGNVLVRLDSFDAAIDYYYKALEINEKNNFTYQVVPCLQNLANEYFYKDSIEKALTLIRRAKKLNEINNWPRYQITNYSIQAKIFEEKGDLDSAIFYLKQELQLSDSVIGSKVQLKIAELIKSQEEQEKEQVLSQNLLQIKNLYSKNKRLSTVVLISTSLLILFLFLFFYNKKRTQWMKQESQATLQGLLNQLEKKGQEHKDLKENQMDLNSLKILTSEDWDFFKANFQETNPGFIQNLRGEFPGLTEAEERLFLLLSLNLKTGELANILGVQKETIKKTRSRLRKKLGLEVNDSLEDFVASYPTYKDK
jgi:tetratricopeptide (TPR) repeat protein